MARDATSEDLIEYLRQQPNLKVVLRRDDIQAPGDYVVLEEALEQINDQLVQEDLQNELPQPRG